MLFSLSMFPVGASDSLVNPVADVVDEIDRAGLAYRVTGADTVIEGEWDEVIPVIRRAEERLRDKHDRVYMVLTVDDHKGGTNRLEGAVADIEKRLGRSISR
ncbi:MAG TPA: thiamine-binding protein [Longimicrobiales bacterium]